MDFINIMWAYVMVFILAAIPFFEVVGVIPLGAFGGLSLIPVAILALLGNLFTVLLVILFVDKIREWRRRRKRKIEKDAILENVDDSEMEENSIEQEQVPEGKRSKRAQLIWNKYGLPGLALIGPFFVGSHLTAFMSITFGATKRSASVWMSISLLFWSILVAVLSYLGFDIFLARDPEDGFITRFFMES